MLLRVETATDDWGKCPPLFGFMCAAVLQHVFPRCTYWQPTVDFGPIILAYAIPPECYENDMRGASQALTELYDTAVVGSWARSSELLELHVALRII